MAHRGPQLGSNHKQGAVHVLRYVVVIIPYLHPVEGRGCGRDTKCVMLCARVVTEPVTTDSY